MQRADWRRLGNDQLHLQIHQDSSLRGTISGARRQGRHVGAEVSRPRALLAAQASACVVLCGRKKKLELTMENQNLKSKSHRLKPALLNPWRRVYIDVVQNHSRRLHSDAP